MDNGQLTMENGQWTMENGEWTVDNGQYKKSDEQNTQIPHISYLIFHISYFIPKLVIFFWFRRDLRLEDNAGLYHALKSGGKVLPVFIFDTMILNKLNNRKDSRVTFIYESLCELKQQLETLGTTLLVKYGNPVDVWKQLTEEFEVTSVYTNRDYEPYALERDKTVIDFLQSRNIGFHTFKDHVIFEKEEVLKSDGTPYTVFTPYSKKWKEKLNSKATNGLSFYLKGYPTEKYFEKFYKTKPIEMPTFEEIGFEKSDCAFPPKQISRDLIKKYADNRDFPAIAGTSKLGIHFRFGTISIREKAKNALPLSEIYLNELIWRDFYAQILAHFPHVTIGAFKPQYDRIEWRNDEKEFAAWCEGKTGYPLVDAGMRELNATGFMHNRVRMLTASFLTKHLLIDWRWGEAYFAEKLLDFDLASNNGGWQWAAGCGTDAAPYFRIFSPMAQTEKFDKNLVYIKKWIPEWETSKYPQPIVEHNLARTRCLEVYKKGIAE